MATETCSFETERLIIDGWHSAPLVGPTEQALADIVASMMTAPVTRALPVQWQGGYTRRRAGEWIAERDGEGTTLLAVERSPFTPVGLLILHESEAPASVGVDVRIGYVLAESAWGRGLGSELLAGFVGWCLAQPDVRSLIAGVAADNRASIRILEKSGFLPSSGKTDDPEAERVFQLRLR
jgi:ribosomal-protein-alanine N-acetyltransferase